MKIGIVGDIHFCEYSSILRHKGTKYSSRLENCIESINWAEKTTENCDTIIYLGDFFDKSSLNASELTAFSELKWNNKHHEFLVGNHEMGINNLIYSSAHIFNDFEYDIKHVIDSPTKVIIDDCEICYLPYLLNSTEFSICEYFGEKTKKKRIIFSHNDIAGLQLGKFVSKSGFSMKDIEDSCDLFINGHLHNGAKISSKIINLGNLTGQNFSEDGFLYNHKIMILDTDTLNLTEFVNPYALNFYKIDNDLSLLDRVINAVVTLKVDSDKAQEAKKLLKRENIVASRLIINYESLQTEENMTLLSVNHLDEFRKFVLEKIGTSDLVLEELDIIDG